MKEYRNEKGQLHRTDGPGRRVLAGHKMKKVTGSAQTAKKSESKGA